MIQRPDLPMVALFGVLAITAVWWAFALWPTGVGAPDWVLRTRYVCFGNRGDGLPTAAGWLLLIGQPISMLGFLVIVWGADLLRSWRHVSAQRSGQLTAGVVAFVLVAGAVLAAVRVSSAQIGPAPVALVSPPQRLSDMAPALVLRDQAGVQIDLAQLRGQVVAVAFAYAHCETICPLIVRDVNDALGRLREIDAVALIVTVDPWRDTPERLPHIAKQWQLEKTVHVLSGAVPEVAAVLAAWKVGVGRDPNTGEIAHAGLVYLVGRDGRLAYALPAAREELITRMRELAVR